MAHRSSLPRAAVIVVVIGCLLFGSLIASEVVAEAGEHSPPPPGNGEAILVVAHEGGRNPAIARQALTWNADVLEMDAVAFRGQLYISHEPITAVSAHSTPLVSQVWPIASRARIVELDLKDASPAFNGLLVTFLRAHHRAGTPQVFVSGRNLQSLSAIHAGAPWVFRFWSIGDEDHLDALRQHPAIAASVDGVSIRQNLLDALTVAWLHQHRLLIFAWTVDSAARAHALIQEGVDGITTDEPAIVGMIVRQEHGKTRLLRDRTA